MSHEFLPPPESPAALGASNALPSAAETGVAPWLKLAGYGDWPHPMGLQRLTRAAAAEMARSFTSLLGRLRRKFAGVPVFVGHPDDTAFAGQPGHEDTRAYAWVTSLEARDDGLYVRPRWSDAGRSLLRNAFYKFLSPRWQMRPLGSGVFEPVRLLSIGLTNHPNIPGDAVANQQATTTTTSTIAPAPVRATELLPRLLEIFELDSSAAPTTIVANAELLAQSARDARAAQSESARFYRLASDADAARLAAERRADQERGARIDLLLANAELRGQLPPADRARWREALLKDFDRALAEMSNALPVTRPAPLTARLAGRRSVGDAGRYVALVRERMSRTGEDYPAAWARTRRAHGEPSVAD